MLNLKNKVVEELLRDKLSDKRLVALTMYGERLHKIAIEGSPIEMLAVYIPVSRSTEDCRFVVGIDPEKVVIDVDNVKVDVTLISFPMFIKEIKEMNIDFLSVLFDEEYIAEDSIVAFAEEKYLHMYRMLVSLRNHILYMNMDKLFNNAKKEMITIVNNFHLSTDFLLDYAKFLRYKRILTFVAQKDDKMEEAFVIHESSPLSRVRNSEIDEEDASTYMRRALQMVHHSSLRDAYKIPENTTFFDILDNMIHSI